MYEVVAGGTRRVLGLLLSRGGTWLLTLQGVRGWAAPQRAGRPFFWAGGFGTLHPLTFS